MKKLILNGVLAPKRKVVMDDGCFYAPYIPKEFTLPKFYWPRVAGFDDLRL